MAYVITEACIGVTDTACVEVCPVDCIHPTKEEWVDGKAKGDMLYINPDECIDCGACLPECPVEAIYEEDDIPDNLQKFIQINADFYK
ncbi:MAG: 4Fe-4S binding protein [Calditrichaeota bacterium]|nr:4Fe-4S binding protein [Calditrichota bacterium]